MQSINRRQAFFNSIAIAATPTLLCGRSAQAAELTYRFGTNVPATHPLNIRANEAAQRIAASLSGSILFIIGAATAMAWGLTQSGFSRSLSEAMTGLPGGAVRFMALSMVAFIVLGSVLEGIPAIVLFGPLLFPIAKAVGIHEVHYAMVVILSMGIGLFAPPFGVGYYAACAIGRVNPDEGIRPILGYLAALFVGLVVVALVPWISIGFL